MDGRPPFTGPAVEQLTDAELEAVAMHELAHIAEPLKVRVSRMGIAPLMWAVGVMRSVYTMAGMIALVLTVGVATVTFRLTQRVAKRMETEADQVAGVPVEDTPVYAHALEEIYRYNLVPAVLPKRNEVHPHLYDRMIAAGAPPDYPRPEPPDMRRFFRMTIVLAFVVATVGVGLPMVADHLARQKDPAAAARAPWLVALHGSHQSFEAAADVALEEERFEAAAAFLRAALEKDSECFYAAYQLTMTELQLGRCERAESALQAFTSLANKSGDPSEQEEAAQLKQLVAKCRPPR